MNEDLLARKVKFKKQPQFDKNRHKNARYLMFFFNSDARSIIISGF